MSSHFTAHFKQDVDNTTDEEQVFCCRPDLTIQCEHVSFFENHYYDDNIYVYTLYMANNS